MVAVPEVWLFDRNHWKVQIASGTAGAERNLPMTPGAAITAAATTAATPAVRTWVKIWVRIRSPYASSR